MDAFVPQQNRPYPLHWYVSLLACIGFCTWYFNPLEFFRKTAGPEQRDQQTTDLSDQLGDRIAITTETDELFDGGLQSGSQLNSDDEWTGLVEPDATPERVSENVAPGNRSVSAAGQPQIRQISSASVDRAVADVPSGPFGAGEPDQVSLSAEFSAAFQDASRAQQEDRILDAHSQLSALYWKYPEHRALLMASIQQSAAMIFASPDQHFGEPHLVNYGETLQSIGREYGVSWAYLARLNRLKPAQLQAGTELKVVRGPFGAVVDLSRMTLTVHAHGWYIQHYPIGIGREDSTPAGRFQVQEKLENPVWYRPEGGVVAADDPQNPLGEYWLGLGNHIGIHGTIDPSSIGNTVSRGCIHLGDDDIEEVFGLLISGSEVIIRP